MSYEVGPKFQMKQAKNLLEHSGVTSLMQKNGQIPNICYSEEEF